MIPRIFSRAIIKETVIAAVIILSPLVFVFAQLPYFVIAKDGLQYSGYALSMLQGHGYTLDGQTFSNVREPGYPFFLVIFYSLFGTQNSEALFVVQLLIIGIVGWLVYWLLAKMNHPYIGIFAALIVTHLPSYALIANDAATETLFTLFVALSFMAAVRIVLTGREAPYHLYLWLGIFCACGTLVRSQLLLFLPFLIFWYLIFNSPWTLEMFKKIGIALAAFVLIVGSWVLYVHEHDGHFAITESRLELLLFTRAMRAELSYSQITEYAKEWVKRSINGGGSYPLLNMYEYQNTQDVVYPRLAKTSAQVQELKDWSINTILEHPGQYLYGNLIETMKILYLHHDYSDTFNRYLRAGAFVLMYAFFLFGLFGLFRKGNFKLKSVSILALFFIVYNILILTPLDTIPRYNIPYQQFYILIGAVGVALWNERSKGTTQK